MKLFSLLIFNMFSFIYSRDFVLDRELMQRYKILTARIEASVLLNHEYYMAELPESFILQKIKDRNDELSACLDQLRLDEHLIVKSSEKLLESLNQKNQVQLSAEPVISSAGNVTCYSFSSVN